MESEVKRFDRRPFVSKPMPLPASEDIDVIRLGTIIQGEYRLIPTTSYWKNIVVAIPTGATEVVITNNNPSVTAGKQ